MMDLDMKPLHHYQAHLHDKEVVVIVEMYKLHATLYVIRTHVSGSDVGVSEVCKEDLADANKYFKERVDYYLGESLKHN